MKGTKIQWATHTFNPWRGCTKISPGCTNCYAETMSRRNPGTLGVWGDKGTRVIAAESYWRQPVRWNRQAVADRAAWERAMSLCRSEYDSPGPYQRPRVFCASLADVFEDRRELIAPRARLFQLIEQTPALDWLLLTKRPERFPMCLPWLNPKDSGEPFPNVWLGVSVEDQARADERIPLLLETPAAVRFLSVEPLLSEVNLTRCSFPDRSGWWNVLDGRLTCKVKADSGPDFWAETEKPIRPHVDWVIVGGESGAGARRFEMDWARSIQAQCNAAEVPFFFKQAGANVWDWTRGDVANHEPPELVQLRLRDRKGGDESEWSSGLREREFPAAALGG